MEFSCQYCGREAKTRQSNVAHEIRCHNNENRKPFTEKWLNSLKRESGKNIQNQYTKAKLLGYTHNISDETRRKISEASRCRTHSDETKKKISKSRKEFLDANPDMVPYKLNHYSRGESYPEIYFKGILDSNGIKYSQEYQIGLYSLDFAILDKKIDLEIDGEQHYLDERICDSDIRRNQFLEDLGWRVIRIRWSSYQKLNDESKKEFCDNLIKQF
jgi:hypothetical protein